MLSSRTCNNMQSEIREGSLKEMSKLANTVDRNQEIINDQQNIQALTTDLFKTIDNLAPTVMDILYTPGVNNFNLENFQKFATERK